MCRFSGSRAKILVKLKKRDLFAIDISVFCREVFFGISNMTIKKARKILGKAGEQLTDEEVQQEIITAEQLKDLILLFYSKTKGGYNDRKYG